MAKEKRIKALKKVGIILIIFAVFLLFFDNIIMPIYVSADIVVVPNVVGLNEEKAKEILLDAGLNPMVGAKRYDEKFPKNSVMFQKPDPGAKVKESRRVYLFISSGETRISAPNLVNKTLREAKIVLEKSGLALGDTISVESDMPKNTIIDQTIVAGTSIPKGFKISVTVSRGAVQGEIRTPDLLGKSLSDAESILASLNLKIGRITYQPSISLLPNTIIDQYPSSGNMIKSGESVDLFVTKLASKEIVEEEP